MMKFAPLIAVATLGLAACGAETNTTASDDEDGVVITVNGVTQSGKIYVALQNEAIFGSAGATYGTAVDAENGSVKATITGVSDGNYAVAVFQDTNGNGQMDVGSNGIPTEPWALSNGAGTKGAPSFSKAMMTVNGSGDSASVTLSK